MKFEEATAKQQEAWRDTFCTLQACSHADVCRGESDEMLVACFEESQVEYLEEFEDVIFTEDERREKAYAEATKNAILWERGLI